jgi:hypothetical protein
LLAEEHLQPRSSKSSPSQTWLFNFYISWRKT